MKKKCSGVMGAALMTVCLGMMAVACGKSEKDPEIVPDPMETELYFISGSVYDFTSSTPLTDVTVTVGSQTVKTATDGTYEVQVEEKKTYEVSFAKDKYLPVSTGAQIAGNAANRSTVTLSVKMSVKSEPVSVGATGGVVGDKSTEAASTTTIEVPAGAVAAGQTVTMSVTPYEEPVMPSTTVTPGTATEVIALGTIAVESTVASFGQPLTLTFKDVASSLVYFSEVSVWASPTAATKVGTGWTRIGTATATNGDYSFQVTELKSGYGLEVNCSVTTGSAKTDEVNTVNGKNEVTVDNSGEIAAIEDYELKVQLKSGWEFTITPTQALQAVGVAGEHLTHMAASLLQIVETHEGGIPGVFTVEQVLTASISGNHIMYYKNNAKYCERSFTFSLIVDGQTKSATVKLKKYIGDVETYSNVEYAHSGGTI